MDYAEQLTQLAQMLSVPDSELGLKGYLASSSGPEQVKLFVDGNLEKRRHKLERQLTFVSNAFDNFGELIIEYIESTVLEAYDTGASDGGRMLDWLLQTQNPTDTQRDYIACQRARFRVEEAARHDRLAYIHFQERYSLANDLVALFDQDESLRAYLNPIRVWVKFLTRELLEDIADPPVNVLFFAVAGSIGTAVLELEGQALLNELAEFAPCSLGEWAALSQLSDRSDLAQFTGDLVAMGLVSIG